MILKEFVFGVDGKDLKMGTGNAKLVIVHKPASPIASLRGERDVDDCGICNGLMVMERLVLVDKLAILMVGLFGCCRR